MFRKFLLGMATTAILAGSIAAQTADELVAKNIEAHGGAGKLKAINTLRMTGKMTLGPGLEVPIVIEQKRPNRYRMEITIQGMTGVQAYDGKTGWMLMPFQGKKDPEPMGEDDLKETAEQSDIDGPLVDYKEKGHRIELVGKEPVEGSDAYKLKVTLKNGGVRYFYLDTDSYLEIKSEAKRTIRGTDRETEAIYGDYKEVDGIVVAHSLEIGAKGSPQKQKITIEKVETNVPVEEARFRMPEIKPADGNKPSAKPENKEIETKPVDKGAPDVKKPEAKP